MSTEMQTKVQASPTQNFTPVQTGFLQRKCTLCNTPGLVADSELDEEKLTLQRSSVDQAGTTTVPRFGHDFSKVGVHDSEPRVIQAKFSSEITDNLQAKTEAYQNKTGMPDYLKLGLENLSNMNLSNVRVHHNSPKPAQLNALAYTQDQDIHVGTGQEKHLPHEGWHAVQQMQGRVKPTMQAKSVSINDDKELEREADVMGAKALQMTRAEQATTTPVHQRSMPLQRIVGSNSPLQRAPNIAENAADIENLRQIPVQVPELPELEKGELIRITGDEITKSNGKFGIAASEIKTKVRLREEAKRDLSGLFTEVVFGLLNPGLGRLIGGYISKLADKIPVGASTLTYTAALAALDPDTVKTYYLNVFEISKNSINEFLKPEEGSLADVAISGEIESDIFLDQLHEQFGEVISTINGKLTSFSSAELGLIYLSHRSSTKRDYAEIIEKLLNKFREQVRPIGEEHNPTYGRVFYATDRRVVFEVIGKKHRRLALITRTRLEPKTTMAGKKDKYFYNFETWITDDMKAMALAKTAEINKKVRPKAGIFSIELQHIQGMPMLDQIWLERGTLIPGTRTLAQDAAVLD